MTALGLKKRDFAEILTRKLSDCWAFSISKTLPCCQASSHNFMLLVVGDVLFSLTCILDCISLLYLQYYITNSIVGNPWTCPKRCCVWQKQATMRQSNPCSVFQWSIVQMFCYLLYCRSMYVGCVITSVCLHVVSWENLLEKTFKTWMVSESPHWIVPDSLFKTSAFSFFSLCNYNNIVNMDRDIIHS